MGIMCMKPKIKISFDDFWHSKKLEHIAENPIYRLLSKRFDLELSDTPDFLIYSSFGINFLKYKCVRIFYAGENVRPNFDECDYAFSFDYPVTERNYRLPLYKLYLDDFEKLKNRHTNIGRIMDENRKFCNFLYSNVWAQERVDFFLKLQKYKQVDSGGKVLNNLGHFVDDKLAFLSRYKFTIAFESWSYPGYTTEKIMHPFIVNSIPIYWGNPLVARDFNPRAFINCHDYQSFDEVVERIIEIDNNDDLYKEYLNEPVFLGNVENEYVNEENILDRFEEIFANKNIPLVAKSTDLFNYYLHLAYIKLSARPRALARQIWSKYRLNRYELRQNKTVNT